MKKKKENVCPCCGKHCSADNLHCSRGMKYFGVEEKKKKDKTVKLMLKCSHHLRHGNAKEETLSFLTEEEKEELTRLLKKCLDQWK
ncbi:MAG: hypothetical protein PUF72_05265 [Clostridiales bacterium]|nr:hypothetical protein [Clostridiales bacterium]